LEIKPIKNRKYNFIGEIEEHKEKLLKRFGDLAGKMEARIEPVQQEENKEIEEKAKIMEKKVAGRLEQLE